MMDSVAPYDYGTPPDSCAEECEELCEGKTVEELRRIGEFFSKKASDMEREMSKNVTVEDFKEFMKGKDVEEEEESSDMQNEEEEEGLE